jgi:hypothetical protein
MAAAGVVESFDVLEDRVGELDAGVPSLPVEDLGLKPCPERFGDGVVVGVTNAAERGQQPGLAGSFGEGPGRELGRGRRG